MIPASTDDRSLDALWKRTAAPLVRSMLDLVRVIAAREAMPYLPDAEYDPHAHVDAREEVGSVLAGVLTVSDLLGRRATLRAADAAGGKGLMSFSDPEATLTLPKIQFHEMIEDMANREPRLASTAVRIADLYAKEHAFAMAKSADIEITKRIQKHITDSLAKGHTVARASERILNSVRQMAENAEDWTRAYSETVFRNAAKTAATAGRFAQVADPDVHAVIGAFRYSSIRDADTRPNHAAAHGIVAGFEDRIWQVLAPPLGHRCRCSLDFVPWDELRRRRLIDKAGQVRPARVPPGAHPDPGFKHKGRPDQALYLGLI